MKLLITLALMLTSVSVFSAPESYVYPQITVWPNGVDVRVYNRTDKDVRCSGSISIWTRSGRFKTEFYSATIYKGMSDYRHFNNWDHQDPYRNGHHSIRCYAY